MSVSTSAGNDQERFEFPDLSKIDPSKSFHSTVQGKIWVRLLINLCWWIHDMYEVDGNNPNSKFQYIENKLAKCKSLFPAQFLFMFSDLKVLPDKQHPFLICRQDEHKTIILVFRATVSSKSLQDVFTDISFYSNLQVYEGSRHAGFSKRAESGPLLAVVNWLQQGWKVIVTGHSLGGAVSQLFTCAVIKSLTEIGLTPDKVVLRCVTFGIPQCADHDFWSSFSKWYDIFDTYIYENDAIFRLATFGADTAQGIVKSCHDYIGQMGRKLIVYVSDDQPSNVLINAAAQIGNLINDALVPKYAVFGRHHFIVKNPLAVLEIKSIGEHIHEKDELLKNLTKGTSWLHYFIEKQLIPSGPFKFFCREFFDHGCYPFAINQLFNQEATKLLGNRILKHELLRSSLDSGNSKSVFNICAFTYYPNQIHPDPYYIYLNGFLVDFIRFATLPIQLAQSSTSVDQKPVAIQEQTEARVIECFKSKGSADYIQQHRVFPIDVTTFFGSYIVLVTVLTNLTDGMSDGVDQLDPVSTILRAYHEFVLDASSIEQTGSPLSEGFSKLFSILELREEHAFYTILARYFAEMYSSNYLNDPIKHLEDVQRSICPQAFSLRAVGSGYYQNELATLKKASEDKEHGTDETRRTAEYLYNALSNTIHSIDGIQLTPLHLEFSKLRQYLHDLHAHQDQDIDVIKEILKSVMAPYFYIKIVLGQLRNGFVLNDKKAAHEELKDMFNIRKCFKNPRNSSLLPRVITESIEVVGSLYRKFSAAEVNYLFHKVAPLLLLFSGEDVSENENEWHIITRINGCRWSQRIIQAKSVQELKAIWNQTFESYLVNESIGKNRDDFVKLIRLCPILLSMRQILKQKPPKVVISGISQTGKSTLFKYLTGRNLKELRNDKAFNTRMSLQCRAFIETNSNGDGKSAHNSGLAIDVVDNPGQDDVTGQGKNLLDMSLHSARLLIIVATLKDVNQRPTIELLDKVLKDTRINILVLINQIDIRLMEEWDKYKSQNSNNDECENDDWGKIEEEQEIKTVIHTTTEFVTQFSAFDKVEELITRPISELKKELTTDLEEVNNRVTIKPVILKDFGKDCPTYNDLKEFAKREKKFYLQVYKSNVNRWIIEKLTGSTS